MKNIALIIANNESKTIKNVVNGLIKSKKEGIIQRVVLVDDGSTDNTAQIAEELGADIIRLPRNVGKGQAFIEGINFCAKENATNVLTFDGDLLELTPKQVKKLLKPLKNPRTNMVLGTIKQDGTVLTGERAIKMDSLKPLWKTKNKIWIKHMQNFGLEATLNHYLGLTSIILPKFFDKIGGSIYNGKTPFNRKVVYANTKFKALPFNRRGQHVTNQAFEKRLFFIKREVMANLKKKKLKKRRIK